LKLGRITPVPWRVVSEAQNGVILRTVADRNTDVASRAIEAFNARDVDAFAALASEDFEWFPSMSPVEGERFAGQGGIRKYFRTLAHAWEHFRVVPERFCQGEELVLVLGRLEGRGRSSGATVQSPLGMAFDVRAGRITRIRGYLDHDEALRDTGLKA
jgi:ketosteroid isomerase-like protein